MSHQNARVALGLGANLPFQGLAGADLLRAALAAVIAEGFPLMHASNAWESAAWPDPAQPVFVNAVAVVDGAGAAPQALLAVLLAVEQRFGRVRRERWAARTLDLDIIDFNGLVLAPEAEGGLILPHPRAHERGFVLAPLAEAWPDWRHPVLGRTAGELLAGLAPDPSLRRLAAAIA